MLLLRDSGDRKQEGRFSFSTHLFLSGFKVCLFSSLELHTVCTINPAHNTDSVLSTSRPEYWHVSSAGWSDAKNGTFVSHLTARPKTRIFRKEKKKKDPHFSARNASRRLFLKIYLQQQVSFTPKLWLMSSITFVLYNYPSLKHSITVSSCTASPVLQCSQTGWRIQQEKGRGCFSSKTSKCMQAGVIFYSSRVLLWTNHEIILPDLVFDLGLHSWDKHDSFKSLLPKHVSDRYTAHTVPLSADLNRTEFDTISSKHDKEILNNRVRLQEIDKPLLSVCKYTCKMEEFLNFCSKSTRFWLDFDCKKYIWISVNVDSKWFPITVFITNSRLTPSHLDALKLLWRQQ